VAIIIIMTAGEEEGMEEVVAEGDRELLVMAFVI